MDTISYKTQAANKATIEKKWYVIDAEAVVLGRLASQVAKVIRGKHKPSYTPHADCGDHVIVINASKVKLTGNKWDKKYYLRHTGFPGGQRTLLAKQVRDAHPNRVVEHAVKGMLPKNRLGRQLFRNLHVFEGSEHNHEAQQPEVLTFKS